MRIRTLTSHNVYNYGASLQAYSLMYYLQALGHDCKIIDYMPEYKRGRYNFWYIDPASKWYKMLKFWPLRLVVCSFLAPKRFKTYSRKKAFDKFTKEKLSLTKRYDTISDLENEEWNADLFIVGSDQMWNTDHATGRDAASYLSFSPNGAKKISYAASFGMDKILPQYTEFVRNHLKSFDAISVRESTGVTILKDIGLNAVHVVDPVFLNKVDHWRSLLTPAIIPHQKYILVYEFASNPLIARFAQFVSQKTGLQIISINDFTKHRYADVNINDAGPKEFITLISEASYFISNSFHGTAFSIIFHTPFFVFKRKKGNVNTRMEDLLSVLHLQDRIINEEKDFCSWDSIIDFENTDKIMSYRIAASKVFLNNQM